MTTYYFGDDFEPTAWDSIVGNQPEWSFGLTNGLSPSTDIIQY